MKVSGLDAIKRWVMQYGCHVEVLEPDELREFIREEIQKLNMIYPVR